MIILLQAVQFILKKDLGYHLNEEEKKQFDDLNQEEQQALRKRVLDSIQEKVLPLDILEDEINRMQQEEYQLYLKMNPEEDVEKQVEMEEFLEKRCHRMIINLALGNSTDQDLLGPDIRETYGIGGKSS